MLRLGKSSGWAKKRAEKEKNGCKEKDSRGGQKIAYAIPMKIRFFDGLAQLGRRS